jgi:hypothetical protein
MGNQKNARKRMPTAKKLAENNFDSPPPSPPSHHTSTRPKPKPTGKAAIKEPSRADLSVTWTEGDTSMIDCDDGENELEEDKEDESSDDLHEEDEEVNDVSEVKRRKATAPPAGM